MNSKCGTHAESYMSLIILYNSIISPRQRLYLSVGKFKNLLLTFSLVQGSGKISSTGYGWQTGSIMTDDKHVCDPLLQKVVISRLNM